MPRTRRQCATSASDTPLRTRRILGSLENRAMSEKQEPSSLPSKDSNETKISKDSETECKLFSVEKQNSSGNEGDNNGPSKKKKPVIDENPLVCRNEEIEVIKSTIEKSIREKHNSSMYISGAPGTGKTAVVRNVCSSLKGCRAIYVNCMRVTDPCALSKAIIQELSADHISRVQTLKCVELYLSKHFVSKPIVLVLDEMDSLAERHQEILYRLFDWPHTLSCRLVILCIANSLDLTDRLLPRLKARSWRPVLLHFKPYSHEQLTQIAYSRLSAKDDAVDSPIDSRAVQLCARKVAAASGDARAMIDICRRSVDLAGGSPASPAGLAHVSRALKIASGSPAPSSSSGDGAGLPLQQKLALAAALLMERREFSLGALLDRYSSLCRERQLPPLDAGEFAGVCQLLEARGMLGMKRAKETRLHKLSVKLDERSVRWAINDQSLIGSVLANGEKKPLGTAF